MSVSRTDKATQYLIIGGTTKAATTSIYYYLGDRPDVCTSSLKETRFFIDEDYPVPCFGSTWWDGIEKYEEFFVKNSSKGCLRVEASPDYLYSLGTPERIKKYLPDAKMVFILRDPITRLVSWYKYAKQRGNIPEKMTFSEYVETQLERSYFEIAKEEKRASFRGSFASQAYFLSALEQGCYSTYLEEYFKVLGREKVLVVFYEDLCKNPEAVLKEISIFAGLDPEFYSNYNFQVFNDSKTMKNADLNRIYSRFRARVSKYTHNLPIHSLLSRARQWFDRNIYNPLNTRPTEKIEITPEIKQKLQQYYREEIKDLEAMLMRSLPWKSF